MADRLIEILSRLGHWGYLLIFIATFLECAAFVGFVIPGETMVAIGGFMAAQGILEPVDLATLVAIAAVLGDSVGYEWGRHLGRGWLERHGHGFGLTQARIERVDRFFERHGGKAVFLGRFSALLRAMMPFMAGASGMRYSRFLPFNFAGGVVWSAVYVTAGYLLGASWSLIEHWVGRASAVLAALVALGLLFAWAYRWLIRHEAGVRRRWRQFLDFPTIAALRGRFEPQIAFLVARLTPGGYLGLYLTAGVVIIVVAGWTFGGIAQDVLAGDPLTQVDGTLLVWLQLHATPGLTRSMRAISFLGSGAFYWTVALALAAYQIIRGRRYRLLALLLALCGGPVLNTLLKVLIHRPGPEPGALRFPFSAFSFPSGHTLTAVLLYGTLAFLLIQERPAWRWRIAVALLALFVVLLVALSNIYLGAAYLSDTLAAMAEGILWLTLCFTAEETMRHARPQAVQP